LSDDLLAHWDERPAAPQSNLRRYILGSFKKNKPITKLKTNEPILRDELFPFYFAGNHENIGKIMEKRGKKWGGRSDI
jgi:hypothetical protein